MDSASVLQHNGRFWQGKVYPPSANFQSTSYGVTAIAHKKLQSHCRAPISESIDTRQLLFLASKNISCRAGSSPDGKGKKNINWPSVCLFLLQRRVFTVISFATWGKCPLRTKPPSVLVGQRLTCFLLGLGTTFSSHRENKGKGETHFSTFFFLSL